MPAPLGSGSLIPNKISPRNLHRRFSLHVFRAGTEARPTNLYLFFDFNSKSFMDEDGFYIYRRRLPHWRLAGSVYFVTWRIHPTQPDLLPEERGIVASVIEHFDGKRYNLEAYVVMSNHVHVLVEPLEDYILQDIFHSWKSFTANTLQKKFGRKGSVWQDEYFDRIVRDEDELIEKAQYILNNPSKAFPEIEDYEWVMVKWEREADEGTSPTIIK